MSTPAGPPLPRPGDTIAGRYRVDQVIGSGGMGCVLSAEHLLLKTRVAIKLLLPQAAAWPGATERFLREAQAAATLRGEHVARVVDMGTIESGAPFMVMEFLHGRDLQKVIAERAPLPISEAVDYLLQIADAIQEAHSLGILHRDIKPANIFVTTRPNGAPLLKVLDFGLAKVRVGDPSAPDAALTQTGQIIGSPHYMPPEQFRGLRHADARSDIWALGVVLYELLTGRRPFTGEGTSGVMAAIFSDEPTPIGILRPDMPEPLAALVMRCLEKRPDRRPQPMTALIAALEPFRPTPERPSQAWIEPPRESLSRSAGVSFGLPPLGAATVRMGPASTAMNAPPAESPISAPDVPSEPASGEAALFQEAPPASRNNPAPTAEVTLPRDGAKATIAEAITAGVSTTGAFGGSSTSANMGIVAPSDADSSARLSTLREAPRPAGGLRLAWILAASVAGIVVVVGVVARAVLGNASSTEDSSASSNNAAPFNNVATGNNAATTNNAATASNAAPVNSAATASHGDSVIAVLPAPGSASGIASGGNVPVRAAASAAPSPASSATSAAMATASTSSTAASASSAARVGTGGPKGASEPKPASGTNRPPKPGLQPKMD